MDFPLTEATFSVTDITYNVTDETHDATLMNNLITDKTHKETIMTFNGTNMTYVETEVLNLMAEIICGRAVACFRAEFAHFQQAAYKFRGQKSCRGDSLPNNNVV